MKRELVLALGILFLGMPTTIPAHTGSSTVAEDSSVQFTATVDGVIEFGNRQNNRLNNESMTLVFDDDDIPGTDDRRGTDDSGSSSRDAAEDSQVEDVVRFKKMLALPESMAGGLSDAGMVRGVQPGGRAWKLANAEGKLKEDGELKIEIQGLLLEGEDMNISSSSFRALVSCVGDAGETTFITPDFPVDELGNARIEHRFDGLGLCIAPVIFVGSGSDAAVEAEAMNDLNASDFRWFAVTGHSFSGGSPSIPIDDSSAAAPVAARSETIPGNGVPPLSNVFGGTPTSPANGIASGSPVTNGAAGTPADNTPPVTGTAPSPSNSTSTVGPSEAAAPSIAGLPPAASVAGSSPLTGLSPVTQPGTSATALSGLASPPAAGTGVVGTAPPVVSPSPIITATPPPPTRPILPGPPDAGTFSTAGPFEDPFPRSTFADPVPAPGFITAPGFPLSSGVFDASSPFRFDGNFTDLALASPVF